MTSSASQIRTSRGKTAGAPGVDRGSKSHGAYDHQQVPPGTARPLAPALAEDLGQRFNADFGSVRVHEGVEAQASAKALQARAYTVGEHIVLGRSAPPPDSHDGKRVLAHELAHVVQQRRGGPPPTLSPDAPHEAAADRAAAAAMSGSAAVTVAGGTGVGVARDEDEEAIRKRNQAKGKLKGVDASTDKAVESGIVEEPTKQPAPASPKTRKVPSTKEAKGARSAFSSKQPGHAKALSVDKGGQVHHGIELQALKRYPGAFTAAELNARENMRGIRPELEGKRQLHNSKIREAWDKHYNRLDAQLKEKGLKAGTPEYRAYARKYLLEARAEMDHLYGNLYSEAHAAEAAKSGKKPAQPGAKSSAPSKSTAKAPSKAAGTAPAKAPAKKSTASAKTAAKPAATPVKTPASKPAKSSGKAAVPKEVPATAKSAGAAKPATKPAKAAASPPAKDVSKPGVKAPAKAPAQPAPAKKTPAPSKTTAAPQVATKAAPSPAKATPPPATKPAPPPASTPQASAKSAVATPQAPPAAKVAPPPAPAKAAPAQPQKASPSTTAGTRVADTNVPSAPPPSAGAAKMQAAAGGLQLAGQGLAAAGNYVQGKAAQEAYQRMLPSIQALQNSTDEGVWVHFVYSAQDPHPDSAINPVPVFSHIETQIGTRDNKRTPAGLTAGGSSSRVNSTWLPPGQRSLKTELNDLFRRLKVMQGWGERETKRTFVGRFLLERKGDSIDIAPIYEARAHLVSARIALEQKRPLAAEESMKAADALLDQMMERIEAYTGQKF